MLKLMRIFEKAESKEEINKFLIRAGIDFYWRGDTHLNVCTDKGWKHYFVNF